MNRRRGSGRMAVAVLLLAVAGVPIALYFGRPFVRSLRPVPALHAAETSPLDTTLRFARSTVGPAPAYNAQITNVQIVDFDQDGRPDLLVCDALRSQVLLYRQQADGTWTEQVLGSDLLAPAHATVVDLDRDGRRDVVVSVLGRIFPSNEHVGRVVWLKRTAEGFTPVVLLDDVRRVADVQAGDLDGDGDLDLVVAVFGYSTGEILWLENRGGERFRDHRLHYAAGTIHVPLADYDGDGDLDVAAVVSQEEEEVWGFENLGGGKFRKRRLHFTVNYDVGSAGLVRDDLDGDGDPDLLLPMGDNLEYPYSYPQPYHGCLWLENRGGWNFVPHRIASFGGAYAAAAGDLDGDGDRDVVLVSMVNDWQRPGTPSAVWLENDGRQNFTLRRIDDRPTHLTTVACGDLNGDGRDDVVAGVLKVTLETEDRDGRLVAWLSEKK